MKKKVTYDPERRTHIAHARMNDDEWTLFMSQLDQLGLSQSEFIRQAIFTAKVNVTVQPVFQSDTLDEIAAQYGKIGSNLNQIARYLNEYGVPYNALSSEVRAAVSDLAALKFEVLKVIGEAYGNDQAYQL